MNTRYSNPLPNYDDALNRALDGVGPVGTESIAFELGMGRSLRESVLADRDLPPFNRSAMDGYAVRAEDIGRVNAFEVVGSIAAGEGAEFSIAAGQVVKIATGAPVPSTADAVIPHELSDRKNPVRFTVETVERGNNIHPQGADARAGEQLIPAGTLLGAQHLGLLAAVGKTTVAVSARPRVIIITTGDEVRRPAEAVAPHQIRNSNQPMLQAAATAMGAEVVRVEHTADDLDETRGTVDRAIDDADLILTTGGVSAGERDFLPLAHEAFGFVTRVRGAAIQPGKPILIGSFERAGRRVELAGLPGNPVSVLATAHLFAWPILRRLLGARQPLPWRCAILGERVTPNPTRAAFRPARILSDGRVSVIEWRGSGDLAHTANADGLLALPVQADPLAADTVVSFLPWAWSA
ncbi:MAG: gephyrin-like molybdotransferase Glp [Phycisphaerales bacterium]